MTRHMLGSGHDQRGARGETVRVTVCSAFHFFLLPGARPRASLCLIHLLDGEEYASPQPVLSA
jgi:hypothetical protein